MRVTVNVIEGPRKGHTFIFDRHDTFIVGRSRFVHCPMPEDMALSRDHFLIEINPPACELRDLGSTNGTFVNNNRVECTRLVDGDMVAAGSSIFRIGIGPSISSQEMIAATELESAAKTIELARQPAAVIRCAGCGSLAGPNDAVVASEQCASGESIQWWCGLCRSEVACLPQPVPHYTTLRELGRGPMGVVYQARHNKTDRMVALKLIMPETATTRAAIDRFFREMSVISQLRHPNIVEWYEQGMTRGQIWFATEYVAGTNLETLAKAEPGRYPINQACRLICQILKGLEHAHGLGFIHRDIKPENILIAHLPEGLTVKISDFGLAGRFRCVGLTSMTFTGESSGALPFHSPNRILNLQAASPHDDLYATAAVLYYLLTCDYIYDETAGGGDLIRILLEEPAIPIKKRRNDIPAEIAAVIDRCLLREAAYRYDCAASMRRAMKPFC
jgi:serine/threonine-protein kinase